MKKSAYQRHIIHALAAGAMAISWATVTHVNQFFHQQVRRTKNHQISVTSIPENLGTKTEILVKSTIPAAISIKDTKIDTQFIRKVEGSVLKGYVPLATKTRSGVTVADGFDLGQMNRIEFSQLPISNSLKNKLLPYVGLTSLKAKNFLKNHPLTITTGELDQLNVIAANKILQPLIKTYNLSSGHNFLDLPASAQTAIFSFAYQNGPGFMHKKGGHELWQYFITQNWQKASSALRGLKMYTSRRNLEASLLDHLPWKI